jgi:hypothetical protein
MRLNTNKLIKKALKQNNALKQIPKKPKPTDILPLPQPTDISPQNFQPEVASEEALKKAQRAPEYVDPTAIESIPSADLKSIPNSIVDELVIFSKNKNLAKQIGSHNATEFNGTIANLEEEYKSAAEDQKAQLLEYKLNNLLKWSDQKAQETKNPAWKKLCSSISSAFEAVGAFIKGDKKAAKQHCGKMLQSFAELCGKGKTFASGLISVKAKTQNFVDRIESGKGQTSDVNMR